jgi:hypothetical protein
MDIVETSSHPSDLAAKLYTSEPAPAAPVTEASSLALRMYGSTSSQSVGTMIDSGAAPIASPKSVTQAPSTSPRSYQPNDLQRSADKLYASPGDATPEQAKPVDKAAKPSGGADTKAWQDRANKVYGDSEPSIEPQDFSDDNEHRKSADRKLYGPPTELTTFIKDTLLDREDIASKLPPELQSAEAKAGLVRELREVALDTGISTTELPAVVRAFGEYTERSLSDQERADQHDQTVDYMNVTYGQDAYKTLKLTREFVATQPKLHKLLSSDAGSDVRIVAALAKSALAWRTRKAAA